MHRSRARAIFTNDAECDDMNSFIHLLLYANDIDIDGLVLSSSRFHYAGDPSAGIEPFRWAGGEWMWDYLDAYEQVYPNLVVHDPSYPTADQLRSVTCVGNVKTTGCMDEDSEGSELIRRAILRDDPCPIWLLAGGGTNTIARALKGIEERWRDSPAWGHVYRKVCDRTRIYMIVTQDDTYRDYICHAWPDLPLLHSTNMGGIAFLINEGNCPPDALALMKGPGSSHTSWTRGRCWHIITAGATAMCTRASRTARSLGQTRGSWVVPGGVGSLTGATT